MIAKEKIDFLRKHNHTILVRIYKGANRKYPILYITKIDNIKFTTGQQPEAHIYLDKLYEEVENGKD